jgi:hypothetical protein
MVVVMCVRVRDDIAPKSQTNYDDL